MARSPTVQLGDSWLSEQLLREARKSAAQETRRCLVQIRAAAQTSAERAMQHAGQSESESRLQRKVPMVQSDMAPECARQRA